MSHLLKGPTRPVGRRAYDASYLRRIERRLLDDLTDFQAAMKALGSERSNTAAIHRALRSDRTAPDGRRGLPSPQSAFGAVQRELLHGSHDQQLGAGDGYSESR